MRSMAPLNVIALLVAFADLNLFSSASASRPGSKHYLHRKHERIHHPIGGQLYSGIEHLSEEHKEMSCEDVLSDDLRVEIDSYRGVVERIIRHVTKNEMGETYRQLNEFVDTYGPRLVTSTALHDAVRDRFAYLSELVPGDVAVQESDTNHRMRGYTDVLYLNALYNGGNRTLLGMGTPFGKGSFTTKVRNFTTDLVLVKSLVELESLSKEVRGNTILFDVDLGSTDEFLAFAHKACPKAEAMGAVAVLLKTANDPEHRRPLDVPHTLSDHKYRIPIFELSQANTDFVARRPLKVEHMRVHFESMSYKTLPARATNVIAEIRGLKQPDETLIVAGHIDTWDSGQELIDDASGAGITWRVLEVLKHLDLVARRSIRIALYTDETLGFRHFDKKLNDFRYAARATQFVLKTDSDSYLNRPLGLSTNVKSREAQCIIDRTLRLFDSIGTNHLDTSHCTPDAEQWEMYGVPTGSMYNPPSDFSILEPQAFIDSYVQLHHDDMQDLRIHRLDQMTAFWAGLAYVLADLDVKLPHNTE